MGRPLNEAKRRDIAMRGLAIIRDRGINISMSELASALNMKRPTLYFYFSDLDALLKTAIAHILEQEAIYIAERLTDLNHPTELLAGILRHSFAFYREQGLEDFVVVTCLWAGGSKQGRADFQALIKRHHAPVHALLQTTLEAAMAQGRMRPCDPTALLNLLHVVTDGSMIHGTLTGVDPEPLIELFIEKVLTPLRLPACSPDTQELP